jgi:hypothetical protein
LLANSFGVWVRNLEPYIPGHRLQNMRQPIKKTLRELLEKKNFEQIAVVAVDRKRALSILVSLTFDADKQIAWRAVEAMGIAAGSVARDDPQFVRNHLRKLYWLLSEESGGVCWMAPQSMAEIVRRDPELFADYVPIVISLIHEMAEEDLEHFRAGILWAIGLLAAEAGEHGERVLPLVKNALLNPDPQVRGMAVWCLGQLGKGRILANRTNLLQDEGQFDYYENRSLVQTTVGRMVQQCLEL